MLLDKFLTPEDRSPDDISTNSATLFAGDPGESSSPALDDPGKMASSANGNGTVPHTSQYMLPRNQISDHHAAAMDEALSERQQRKKDAVKAAKEAEEARKAGAEVKSDRI